jgi:TonB family protein
MTPLLFHLLSLSLKIALLGGVVWLQLLLLRRAPAISRSRLCAVALAAIVLLIAGEALTPVWILKSPQITISTTAMQTAAGAAPRTSLIPLTVILAATLWLIGVAAMSIRAVIGRIALARTTSSAARVDSISGVDVRLAGVQTPMLAGLRRPVILLPLAARNWSDSQRDMVVTHELTHFRRGDVWTNLLAQIVRVVFWFHPVVWALIARLSREQELTCDEAVVAAGHRPHEYAAFLLDEVRGLKSADLLACSMAGSGAESLKQRFASLLDASPRVKMTGRVAALVALFGVAAMTLSLVRPVWAQQDDKVYKVGDGVSAPKLLHKVEPKYTQEAKDAKIQGAVRLKIVVTAEGVARDIEVVQGLGGGLDQKAVEAVQQWTFQPATKDGKAVSVAAVIEVNFRLQ